MSVCLRGENSYGTTTFVRGGEEVSFSKKRKGDVNTSHGAPAFTAEESTSFYGNLVGLPSNVRLSDSSDETSTWPMKSSNLSVEATGNDGVGRVSSISVPLKNLSDSNIGFQLLKKSGWKEGTGLGVSEQGRLDPVETHLKQDRRGIGADLKMRQRAVMEDRRRQKEALEALSDEEKQKGLSKKARKALAKAQREQEQALSIAFYREFWPENV